MLIETEKTPNPATLKFLIGTSVMDKGTYDFADAEAAQASPLATALFALNHVSAVFFGSDFISVTIDSQGDWKSCKPWVLSALLDHFSAGLPLFHPGQEKTASQHEDDAQFAENPEDADIVNQIKELIDSRVRPAVANDGGDIVYRGFDRGTVYLAMQGACAGCPSSTATLKQGIEALLKHYVPEVSEVRAV